MERSGHAGTPRWEWNASALNVPDCQRRDSLAGLPAGPFASGHFMASSPASKDSASLADFLQLLRLRKALVALIVALVLVTTIVITAFSPRWYLATTKIRVEKPEGEVKLFQAQSSSYYDPYFLQDQFKIMQSETIVFPVIEHLGLNAKLAPLGAATAPPPAMH